MLAVVRHQHIYYVGSNGKTPVAQRWDEVQDHVLLIAKPEPSTCTQSSLQPPQRQSITPKSHSPTMLQRSSRRLLPTLSRRIVAVRSYGVPTDNPVPANDPNPKTPHSPVSSTNALPTSSEGSMDRALQELPEDGEKRRVMQAPNREGTWSRSQKPRAEAMVGPRFEQTIMEDQVCPARTPLLEWIWDRLTQEPTAPTLLRHGAHSQAARTLDDGEGRLVRRRWRAIGSPARLHQRRQAADQLVHVLRSTIRMCRTFSIQILVGYSAQLTTHRHTNITASSSRASHLPLSPSTRPMTRLSSRLRISRARPDRLSHTKATPACHWSRDKKLCTSERLYIFRILPESRPTP